MTRGNEKVYRKVIKIEGGNEEIGRSVAPRQTHSETYCLGESCCRSLAIIESKHIS